MKKDDFDKLRKNILKKIKIFLNLFFYNNKKIENTQIKILKEPDSLKNKKNDLDIKRQNDIEEAKFYEKILENPENFLVKDDSEYDEIFYNDEIDSYKENMETLSKEELLKRYDEIRKGTANIEDLTNSDLIKIEALLKAEISIQNRNKEYEKVEREIFELEEENKVLMEKIKKLKLERNNYKLT